jgi:hypothetical protein
MARGWESKAVEDQVQDLQTKIVEKGGRQVTLQQADVRRRRDVLILSRTRVRTDLDSATDQRYRDQLSRALKDIEMQISALEEVP